MLEFIVAVARDAAFIHFGLDRMLFVRLGFHKDPRTVDRSFFFEGLFDFLQHIIGRVKRLFVFVNFLCDIGCGCTGSKSNEQITIFMKTLLCILAKLYHKAENTRHEL
ncbi:hypothetical protein [Planococcus sp. MB-3u-03]|uniref:hypothetical protein n=1 Tax=Planococcus sp. MB-3u-03 TaxID=2058136 RepID=UPI002FCD724E